jgi:hypothetical protein
MPETSHSLSVTPAAIAGDILRLLCSLTKLYANVEASNDFPRKKFKFKGSPYRLALDTRRSDRFMVGRFESEPSPRE